MIAGLAACGGGGTTETPSGNSETPGNVETTPGNSETPSGETATDPDSIPDTMTSEDGKFQVAFVTDVGQLKDKSFNQGTCRRQRPVLQVLSARQRQRGYRR